MDRAGNRLSDRPRGASAGLSVLNISLSTDLTGDAHRTRLAFERHTDWDYRHTARRANRYGFPPDLPWSDRHRAYQRADVIHHRQMFAGPPKPSVLHHAGTYYRQHHARLSEEARVRRAIEVGATLDLCLIGGFEWLPAPYDLDWLATFRQPQPVLTIAHAGTNPESKSTGPFLAACERLSREIPLRVVLIQRATWTECLERKGSADIYFDQVLTGIGNNAIEAMGMGIPVIAGIEPAEARKRGHLIPDATPDEMVRRWDGLPFMRADEGSIYDALRLLVDPLERERWSARGLAHVQRFHDERVVVRQLESVYRRALEER